MTETGSETLPPELLDMAVELMGRAGRGGAVRVRGRSMIPTLREGQLLAVEFSPARPRFGDVLVFRLTDYLVVHRYLGRGRFPDGRRSLRLRGDGTPAFDPHVEPDRVVARVLAARTDDGWRDFQGTGARWYGRAVALHDLFWGFANSLARLLERGVRTAGLPLPLARWTTGLDRRTLGVAHRVAFRGLHPRIPEPAEAGAVGERPER